MPEKHQPSNGTEGEGFISAWCGNCSKDKAANGEKDFDDCSPGELCKIVGDTMLFSVQDEAYPPEWTYNDDGSPICTAFDAKDKQ